MTSIPKRTIKEAIDLDRMQIVTSDMLLSGNHDFVQKIRHEATNRQIQNNCQYVCTQCGHAVYVSARNRKPFWQHYQNAPQSCPWWTGNPDTIDNVSASQFKGQQESPLHHKLKHTIGDILKADTTCENTKIEEFIIGESGRRKPDIQTTHNTRKIAFEIQLATTQIPIILQRENFYKNEDAHLIWLVWQFETKPIKDIQQAFLDVMYRHRNNILSLDSETIHLSRDSKKLFFRAYSFDENEAWQQKLISLDDLKFPKQGLPYYFSTSWQTKFRDKWLQVVTADGIPWNHQEALLTEAALKTTHGLWTFNTIEYEALTRVINFIFSFEKGHPIGTKEANLFAYTNTFLSSASRNQYANIVENCAVTFNRSNIIEKDTVYKKLQLAKNSPQLGKETLESKILIEIFSDWIDI
ncbi:MAG: hypothetical protein IT560_13430 [Alphaproteobacteria bacterium]|nr:hypothetical protein [Alphaproteobacteria bacterium]